MCGIVAYVGHRQAQEVIIKGLKRLEYRGYDSAGIALLNGGLNIYKKKEGVELEEFIKVKTSTATSEWPHPMGHPR
jgi:glucosamine--fructose-6-phosphate aminotransferase (isomerizing)